METQSQLTRGMHAATIIKTKLQLALLGFTLYPGDQDFPTALASVVAAR